MKETREGGRDDREIYLVAEGQLLRRAIWKREIFECRWQQKLVSHARCASRLDLMSLLQMRSQSFCILVNCGRVSCGRL